jgi:hypothetical protein
MTNPHLTLVAPTTVIGRLAIAGARRAANVTPRCAVAANGFQCRFIASVIGSAYDDRGCFDRRA